MITLYPLTCTLKLQFLSDGVTLSKEDLEALKQSFPFAESVVRYGYKERHVYLLGARLIIRLPKVKVNFCNPVTGTTWHKYHEIIPVFILPHIRYACLTLLLVALSLFGICLEYKREAKTAADLAEAEADNLKQKAKAITSRYPFITYSGFLDVAGLIFPDLLEDIIDLTSQSYVHAPGTPCCPHVSSSYLKRRYLSHPDHHLLKRLREALACRMVLFSQLKSPFTHPSPAQVALLAEAVKAKAKEEEGELTEVLSRKTGQSLAQEQQEEEQLSRALASQSAPLAPVISAMEQRRQEKLTRRRQRELLWVEPSGDDDTFTWGSIARKLVLHLPGMICSHLRLFLMPFQCLKHIFNVRAPKRITVKVPP